MQKKLVSLLTNNYPKIYCNEENILIVMYIFMSWLYFFSSNQPLVLYKYGRKDHVVYILHYNIFGHFSWGGGSGTSYWFFPSLARLKSINLMWFSGLMLQRIFTFLEHAPTSMRTKTAIMPTIWERERDKIQFIIGIVVYYWELATRHIESQKLGFSLYYKLIYPIFW